MFNTTKIYNTTNHPKKLEVTEYRAPTDESVKILKELEEEAMNKIIAMGKVEDNVFNAKWYIYGDHCSWEDWCQCVFTLNGEEYDFKFLLPGKYVGLSEIVPKIKEEILVRLTNIFLNDLFVNCQETLVNKFKNRR